MALNNIYGGRALRIAIGITVLVLLLMGGASAQVSCDQANDLLQGKLYEQAQAAYVDLLNTSRECAKEGFLELQRAQARNLYELGQAYEKANQENAAKDAYAEALKKDPNSSETREALARVNGGLWGRFLTLVYSLLTSVGNLIAVILIFILLYYAFLLRLWPRLKELKKPRLGIQDFDTGATNLSIGKGMVAMVEEKIKWFEKERYHHQKFDLVATIPMETLAIPADIKSISPATNYISQLVEWLFPPNVITLSGYMEKPEVHGSGLSLTLVNSRSGEIIGSQTLWQEDYGPVMRPDIEEIDPESYYSLVEPAAIWTFFQLHSFSEKATGSTTSLKIFNTGDWQSYTYFRAGVNLKGKTKERKMYLKALDCDPDNVGALLNLGYSDMGAKEFRRAIERLGRVMDIMKSDKKEYFVWFMASYHLSATYYDMGEKGKAMDEAKKLIDKIREVYKPLKDEPLMKFLDSFKPKAEILFAVILAENGKVVEAEQEIKDIKKDLMKLTYASRYNLACYYSIVGEKLDEEAAQIKAYKDALNHLNYALESGNLVMHAKDDKSLKGLRQDKRTKENFIKLIKKYSLAPTQEAPERI